MKVVSAVGYGTMLFLGMIAIAFLVFVEIVLKKVVGGKK